MHELDSIANLTAENRVLLINPLDTWWSYHLSLEILFRAKSKTQNIIWANVSHRNSKLLNVNDSDYISKYKYKDMAVRIGKYLDNLGIVNNPHYIQSNRTTTRNFGINSLGELRRYEKEDTPVGAIVYSALTSKFKTTSFEFKDVRKHSNLYLNIALSSYKKILNNIQNFQPDYIFTLNDRYIASSIALSLGEKSNIKTRVFYWGSDVNSIEDYKISLYSSDEWRCKVQKNYIEFPPSEQNLNDLKESLTSKQDQISDDSKSFLTLQTKGKSINKLRKTCVFYANSEHEHSPMLIKNSKNKPSNQYDAFLNLIKLCDELEIDLILKHHPLRNGLERENKFIHYNSEWAKIIFGTKVLEILPNSDIDTYKLIHDADINAVWSSTVGLECVQRNLPTLVLGDPQWLNPDWRINAWTNESLRENLIHPKIDLDKSSLIKYEYYLKNFGSQMIFSSTSNFKPLINNEFEVVKMRFIFKIAKNFLLMLKNFIRTVVIKSRRPINQ